MVKCDVILNPPLQNPGYAIETLLHTKLGLMKQFVKALDKHGYCFNYFVKKFPGLSKEKLKAGIFEGPQICKLIQDQAFTSHIIIIIIIKGRWCQRN